MSGIATSPAWADKASASARRVIVRAGFKQGYHVLFCDKKGLAIRNGSVFSQITFTKGSTAYVQSSSLTARPICCSASTRSKPCAACRRQAICASASPEHTVAVVNAYKTPTILTLLGKDDFSVTELEDTLRRYTKSDEYFGLNVAGISEHFFGTKFYANVVLLGIAFQRGLLPLSFENIEWGLRETMGSAAAREHQGVPSRPQTRLRARAGPQTRIARNLRGIHRRTRQDV